MADDLLTLSDMVADAFDLADIEVRDIADATPFLNLMNMEGSSNGTTHKYAKETGAPVVGFRSVNDGRDHDHSVDSVVSVDLKYLDFSWTVDQAAADAWRKGREDLIAREGIRHVRAALKKFETQVINGTTSDGDSAGFTGFRNAATIDAVADSLVVDATGTTADTASSVYAVRMGMTGITGVYRGDGPSISLGDTTVQRVAGSSTGTYPAYYTPGGLWLALQVGGIYDMGRIANLTEDSGKGLTDDLISDLLSQFPVGFGPTHLVMSRRSRKQLQQSRTATTTSGAPAPFPTEAFGVPIVVTDSVLDTEAILS